MNEGGLWVGEVVDSYPDERWLPALDSAVSGQLRVRISFLGWSSFASGRVGRHSEQENRVQENRAGEQSGGLSLFPCARASLLGIDRFSGHAPGPLPAAGTPNPLPRTPAGGTAFRSSSTFACARTPA